MRYWATVLFLVLSPAHSQTTDVIRDHVRRNYQVPDPAIPDHAVIMRWHAAVVANDYETWRTFATKADAEAGRASREVFRKLRATAPKKIFITPKPNHKNPNGSLDWGVSGCATPKYFDSPYKEGVVLPDHPVLVTRMATPHREAGGRVLLQFPDDLFLPSDPAPCNDAGFFD